MTLKVMRSRKIIGVRQDRNKELESLFTAVSIVIIKIPRISIY